MKNLVEFKVSKTIFDDVKNDPGMRCGFEAEFHVANASELLVDEEGRLPEDFETYSTYYEYDPNQAIPSDQANIAATQQDIFHEDQTLWRLCQLFEEQLGLAHGDITIEDSRYRKWKLMVDASLYDKPGVLKDPDHDMGVELISPIMTLREGLTWMAEVFEMISTFQHGNIHLYTTNLCSVHVNLSHVLMEYHFDYAKLAIMGGDEHYLADFDRIKNKYTQPILRAVYDELVASKEGRPAKNTIAHRQITQQLQQNPQAPLNLLNFSGWDGRRVMYDLSTMIPLDHHMSVDFRRVTSNNPYVEIRIAGNAGYERRYDEISKMTVRYGALIKIACDPNAYREEYMKKLYQLVSGVSVTKPAQAAEQSRMPQIRVFLQPVMSRTTRAALDQIETYLNAQKLSIPNGAYLFLTVLRSAMDMHQEHNLRVRQGLSMLLKAVGLTTTDLTKALNNRGILGRYGVLRSSDTPQATANLVNTIKTLDLPVTRQSIMAAAMARAQERYGKMLQESASRKARIKKRVREASRQQVPAVTPRRGEIESDL